jgi:oligoendopeptidase F
MGQLQNLMTKIGETFSFVTPEIRRSAMSGSRVLKAPALADWGIALRQLRHDKQHILSEKRSDSAAGTLGARRLRRDVLAS